MKSSASVGMLIYSSNSSPNKNVFNFIHDVSVIDLQSDNGGLKIE